MIIMDPDPRVQVELENLNTSTEFINKLELELEKARLEFNNLLNESAIKIEQLSRKLGSSIEKARPYYETKQLVNDLHQKVQQEAKRYEQAIQEHNNAKDIVQLAEQTIIEQNRQNQLQNQQQQPNQNDSVDNLNSNSANSNHSDPEIINIQNNDCNSNDSNIELEKLLTKSAEKVNQSEIDRKIAEQKHLQTSKEFAATEQNLLKLHNQLKRSIVKASMETRRNFLELNNYANQHRLQLLPYFEMKSQFNQMLDEQVNKIRSYESRVNKAKENYTNALKRLEELNNKIYDNNNTSNKSDRNGRLSPADGRQQVSGTHGNDNNDEDVQHENNTRQQQPQQQPKTSDTMNIFDDKTILDQLILNDQLDDDIDRLKIKCLSMTNGGGVGNSGDRPGQNIQNNNDNDHENDQNGTKSQ